MLFPLMTAAALAATPDDAAWESTLDEVTQAVVSIKVTATRDFDTESASSSQGTGFVVDAERGLVLTNRHMVHAGPVTARAIFLDNEEVKLQPIYRDPVHDFGVYRFDPSELRFTTPTELTLAPDAPKVGMEIRVVGNDAGEKLSILDGTLARLDRNAPFYGRDTYNDFNTFYLQAASNTSGGSSGSPVVDVQGRAVALNAGGKGRAASSYYLPLTRVERALTLLRAGEPVTRGTLQTTWEHQPFQDLRRLGLPDEVEARVRRERPGTHGMLVVRSVVPGAPAHTVLQPGDVLVSLEGELVTGFAPLEAVLDDAVGSSVSLSVSRLGQVREVELPVGDLHAITPDAYVEVGRAVVHDLSYQQARNHDVPVAGVYVASTGYMFGGSGVRSGDLILQVEDAPTPDLDAFAAAVADLPDGARVRVRHAPVSDVRRVEESVVLVDRTWFPMRRCVRDDTVGRWPCEDAAAPPPRLPAPPASTTLPLTGSRKTRRVASALVLVDFDVPYSTAGVAGQYFLGAGVVVDAEQGLVVVDRDTVPVALGDLVLTFGGAVRVPATVRWLHPAHNFAIVQYDPDVVADVPVGEVRFRERWVEEGDEVGIVGLDAAGRVVEDDADVDRVGPLLVAPTRTPRFRERNLEGYSLARVDRSIGGVVVDKRGRPIALWASTYYPKNKERYFHGVPAAYLNPVIEALRDGEAPAWRDIGIDLVPVSLADARDRGLPDRWVERFVTANPEDLEVFEVARVAGEHPALGLLAQSDLVLAADDVPLTRMRDVEAWSQRDTVDLTLLRRGEVIEITVPTVPRQGQGVRRVVSWAGALLHDPHLEVGAQRGIDAQGVYVAWYWYGSPAARDGLRPTRRILAVNGAPTPDLDRFLEVVGELDPTDPVVLKVADLEDVQQVLTLELDLDAWPTEAIAWTDDAWERTRIAP